MSQVPTRGNRNGRAVKVMVFLEKQKAPALVGDIIAAVEPGCDCALMYGTLSTLHRRDKVIVSKVGGRNRFSLAPGALINQRTGTRLDKPPIPVKKAARARAAARREAKALAAQRPVSVRRTAMPPAPKSGKSLPRHEPFVVSANSIHHRVTNAHGGAYMAAKQVLSAVISSDIAAFEAAGGVVEKLSTGASSRPLSFTYREQAQQLTQLHNAAQKRAKGGFKKSTTTDVDADLDD